MTHPACRAATALVLATTLGFAGAANADMLYGRLNGQAVYDATTNLTWLTNADAGYGSSYDSADGTTDGLMTSVVQRQRLGGEP